MSGMIRIVILNDLKPSLCLPINLKFLDLVFEYSGKQYYCPCCNTEFPLYEFKRIA